MPLPISRQIRNAECKIGRGPTKMMVNQMGTSVETSELWQRSFADEGTNADVSRLVTSLRGIRRNAKHLTSKIAGSLPDLTIHDISHLDALWDVAGTVVGPKFPLNPLEAYIFGAAVLLHDAGLCFEAFSGGRDAVRATLQWRDAYGRLAGNSSKEHNPEREADYEALRTLHATHVAKLAINPWPSSNNEELYLIDDSEIREHYGRLVGEIASSHHWKLEQVVGRFSTRRPPAAFLEADWDVDSLKIACMLRVADAGHIDGARAPSFLLKVLQMNSVSRTHWTAQNRLGRLTVKSDDPELLTIASTSPFPRDEAEAWWVAFDLVDLFDKELRGCNEVLETASGGPRLSFARKRVTGAAQVRELAKHVETTGWEPTDSTVHVSDVSALVAKLGGEQLYGRDADRLNVVLRELIQNAADAISARQSVAKGGFLGRITVRLKRRGDSVVVLQVDDDGVGMSEATLSKDLLDFGKSFWASERAAREFPGIHASGYSSIGHFGIGFFSIFMAADKVNVFSRRFDKGLEDVRCLSFENGITLRPTLSADRPSDFGMDICTRVELNLKPCVIQNPNQIEIRCNVQGHENFTVTFKDYVAALVAGVNAPVFVDSDSGYVKVHEKFPPDTRDRDQWLQSLSYVDAGVNAKACEGLNRAVHRLRVIRDGERTYGLAAIDVMDPRSTPFLSAKSVGGLCPPHGRYDQAFVGLIDHLPANARRDAGEIAASKQSVNNWLTEQLTLLKSEGMSEVESLHASYSVCQLGYDPKDFLKGIYVYHTGGIRYWPMHEIGARLKSGFRLGFLVSAELGHLDPYVRTLPMHGFQIYVVFRNGSFNEGKLSDGVPKEMHSLIGVLHRILVASGHRPKWTIVKGAYRSFIGMGDILEVAI